jgi:radical SAM protein with 4Fe4S-binding SPASM domain
MKANLNGLSRVNIELTSRCEKSCHFCGHQDPKINKSLEYGDMDIGLLRNIHAELPGGITIQFHRDGEPLQYGHFEEAISLFCSDFITNIVTSGMRLMDRTMMIGRIDSLTLSVFRGDTEAENQWRQLTSFLKIKGDRSPLVLVKIVGDLEPERMFQYRNLKDSGAIRIIGRALHVPGGSRGYRKSAPAIPEIGICLDFLNHPSIDWQGNLYICNRLSPDREGLLGNLNTSTLADLWNSQKRMEWLKAHREGRRSEVPLCKDCEFWGIPVGN